MKKINVTRDTLPQHIHDLIRQRNRLRRQWQRDRDTPTRLQMTHMSRQINVEISKHLNTTWQNKLEYLRPQDNTLWRIAKALKKEHKPISTLEHNNTHADTDQAKANALAETFEQIHNNNTADTEEQTQINETVHTFINTQHTCDKQQQLKKLYTKPSELARIAKHLPNNKAPGHDNIDNSLIKNLSKKAYTQLTYIINTIYKLRHFPKQWKIAHIIPIQKPNKNASTPDSYRPISLLPTLAKLTEKTIHDRLTKLDKKLKITPDIQFGFRQRHNTVQQVARIVNDRAANR